jgi:methanethiol S-methyltransferase
MKFWILGVLWISYCSLHSGLISPAVTSALKQKLGGNYKYFRLWYNLFAVGSLIPVVYYTYTVKQTPFFIWQGYLLPVRYFFLAIGLLILYDGARHYDMQTFLGLKQIKEDSAHILINTSGKIDSSGILGVIRHPFYSASLMLLWVNNLDLSILIVNLILSLYLIIGTFLEERKLIREFGDEYYDYQKRVSMLFPIKWIFRRFQ